MIAAAATLVGEALELTDADDAVDEGASVAAVKSMIDCEVLEATEEIEEDEEVVLAEDDTADEEVVLAEGDTADDVEELEVEEVEGLPPPRMLDRILVASPGVSVVVTVASVMVAEGKSVTVTVGVPAVPEEDWDAVDVPFVSVPKMPPVAPVAAMTDAALASLVQVNN